MAPTIRPLEPRSARADGKDTADLASLFQDDQVGGVAVRGAPTGGDSAPPVGSFMDLDDSEEDEKVSSQFTTDFTGARSTRSIVRYSRGKWCEEPLVEV